MKSLTKPRLDLLLIFLLVLLASLGQLQAFKFFEVKFYLHELIMGIVFISYLYEYKFSILSYLLGHFNQLKWIKYFVIFLFTSFFINQLFNFNLEALLYLSRFLTYLLIFVFIIPKLINNTYKLSFLYLMYSGLILVYGVVQLIFLPDTRFLSILGFDDHYQRLISTLFDPNLTSIVLVLGIIFVQLNQRLNIKLKFILSSFFVLSTFLTFSRSGILSLIFLLTFQLMKSLIHTPYSRLSNLPSNSLLFLIILVSLSFGIYNSEFIISPLENHNLFRTNSATSRLNFALKSLELNQPYQYILGEGIFTPQKSAISDLEYRRANTARFSDNLLIFVYRGTGILGLGLFILSIGQLVINITKTNQLIGVGVVSFIIHSQFTASYTNVFCLISLWGLISLLPSRPELNS